MLTPEQQFDVVALCARVKELEAIVAKLAAAMEWWGDQEDGIPEDLFDDYQAAKALLAALIEDNRKATMSTKAEIEAEAREIFAACAPAVYKAAKAVSPNVEAVGTWDSLIPYNRIGFYIIARRNLRQLAKCRRDHARNLQAGIDNAMKSMRRAERARKAQR